MLLNEIIVKYPFITLVNEPFMKLFGREKELKLIKETFYKKRMKNIILVGDAGSGKTAIIEQFSKDNSYNYSILSLDMASCVANTKFRGEFEGKLTSLFKDVYEYNLNNDYKPIVLFIDEIHLIMNCGSSEGGMSAANILKPYLSNRVITIIGATTKKEYANTISKDLAMVRRLSPVFISNLDKDVIIKILNKFSNGRLDNDILDYIYNSSLKLRGTNPDISLEITDRALARKKCTKSIIDKSMIDEITNYMIESENELNT